MDGHSYKTMESKMESKKNEIFIPFSNNPSKWQAIILQRDDDPTFCVLSHFEHKSENYSFNCGIYVDREQLLQTKKCQILLRPSLSLNSQKITVKLLENVKITLKISKSDKVDVDKTFSDLHFKDVEETTLSFTVPKEPRKLRITLTCELKNISKNKREKFTKTETFTFNQIDTEKAICVPHLIPTSQNGYILSFLGKNGEPFPKRVVNLSFTHRWFASRLNMDPLKIKTVTDENERIYLQILRDFKQIFVKCQEMNISTSWNLDEFTPNTSNLFPSELCFSEKEGLLATIPYSHTSKDPPILRLFDPFYGQTFHDSVRYDKGCIQFFGLTKGEYILRTDERASPIKIKVVKGDYVEFSLFFLILHVFHLSTYI